MFCKKILQKIKAIERKQNDFHKHIEKKIDRMMLEIEKKNIQWSSQGAITKNIANKIVVHLDIEKKIKERKHAYYKPIRSHGISLIYKEFLNRNTPFIPKKFREGHITGKSERQKERVKELEITKVSFECERLEEGTKKNEHKLKTAEQEVARLIQEYEYPEKRQELTELWIKETTKEEKVSKEI